MLARRLRHAGWNMVLLVGGATSLIGDPGGKDEERPLKTRDEIAHNVAGIASQMERLFKGEDFTLVDNYTWFKDIGFLEFLRDVGKHYSMTELLQRDFIADRLGENGTGISYAEFSYTMVQGYDYWHLFRNHGVVMQIGGSDQWGNMLSGVPLIRKKEGKEVHALSMPLVINKVTGKKFGKSEDGAVWLDPHKTSIYKFYQFWLNADDAGVEDYLKVFTLLDKLAVDTVMKDFQRDKSARLAQKTLAFEVTKIVHGEAAAQSAKQASEVLFGSQQFQNLNEDDIAMLKTELPTAHIADATALVDVLTKAGLASSKGEATRYLTSGAISVNGQKMEAVTDGSPASIHFQPRQSRLLLKRGKNTFVIIEQT